MSAGDSAVPARNRVDTVSGQTRDFFVLSAGCKGQDKTLLCLTRFEWSLPVRVHVLLTVGFGIGRQHISRFRMLYESIAEDGMSRNHNHSC